MKSLLPLFLVVLFSAFVWSCEPKKTTPEIPNIGPEILSVPKHSLSSDGDGYYYSYVYNTTGGPLFPDPNMFYSYPGYYDFHSAIMTVTGVRL